MKHFKSIVDIIGITALLELYIWRWQMSAPHAWIAIAVWLAASFMTHRDTPRTLGWRVDNLGAATRGAGIVLGSYAIALIVIGLARGAATRIPQNHGSLAHLGRYFAFCIFQQVVLNSLMKSSAGTLLPTLAGSGHCRHDFCRRPLAESSPRAVNLHRRYYDGLAFCARAQHPAAGGSPGNPEPARLVGVSDCVASRPARRTRLLHLHSMITRFS